MKNYNEMADAVFRRRDEFVAARKKRNGILIKAGASVCALLLVAVVGIGVWRALPQVPSVKPTEPTTASSYTEEITSCPEQTQDTQTTQTQKVTESKSNTPQAEDTPKETLPPDPTEPNTDQSFDTPQTGEPGIPVDSTSAGATDSDSVVRPDDSTEAVPPTVQPVEPTTVVWEDQTLPGLEPTTPEATEPTEPPTGPLYIECSGKTYEAQTGDMVTLTVELQADELIKSANVIAKYDYYYGRLEVVNLEELGFTEKQLRQVHAPNLGDALSFISYNAGNYGRYRAVKLDFVATENEFAVDFTESKVLLTFSFIVKKPGNTKVELVPNNIVSVNDTEYYRNGNQVVDEGVELDAYLTIIPAAEVVLPTSPAEEEKPEGTPFTYPEESTDGELIINCDGRTYSADVGDTVTFVTELKADEMFINIHVVLDYPEEYLSLNVPQKGKQAFPNMYGMTYNFEGYKDSATGEVVNPAVIMVATDIYGFDFTSRQVLAQLEFEVIKAGEIDLDMHFEDMGKYNENAYVNEAYFDGGVQKSFDDIYIYDYVLVEDKSSQ